LGWQPCHGLGGSFAVEWVATFPWIRWQLSHGMGGRLAVENAPFWKHREFLFSLNSEPCHRYPVEKFFQNYRKIMYFYLLEKFRSCDLVKIGSFMEW